MYTLVVLFAVMSAAVAEPQFISAPLAYGAVVAPAAVSHQARVDLHTSPLAYSSPLVHYLKKRDLIAASPLAYSGIVAPAAVSHQSRYDVHHSGLIAHAPLAYHYLKKRSLLDGIPLVHSSPAVVATQAISQPVSVLSEHGVPLDTVDVVAARTADTIF